MLLNTFKRDKAHDINCDTANDYISDECDTSVGVSKSLVSIINYNQVVSHTFYTEGSGSVMVWYANKVKQTSTRHFIFWQDKAR